MNWSLTLWRLQVLFHPDVQMQCEAFDLDKELALEILGYWKQQSQYALTISELQVWDGF